MITLHPEATSDPVTLKFVTDVRVPLGPIVDAGASLRPLVDAGVVTEVCGASDGVLITVAHPDRWRTDGARVRTALIEALEHADDWRPAQTTDADERIAAVADDVLAGTVGDYVRSHGGTLTVEDVSDGVVTVRADGTCSSCPALDLTLQARLGTAIRSRAPEVREVRLKDATRPSRLSLRLPGRGPQAP